ncbi:MAG: hypothetical protein ABH831_02535 [Candidatus Nealsonbacteria bacterium]
MSIEIKINRQNWRKKIDKSNCLKQEFRKMIEALAEGEKKERKRPSGLPKDWQNRILKN